MAAGHVFLVVVVVVVGAVTASAQFPISNYFQQSHQGTAVGPGLRSSRPRCNAACTRIYLPVCGSDRKTYPSLCVLDYYSCSYGNVTYAYPGECAESPQHQCPASCSLTKQPVCGSDGRTYANECRLLQASCALAGAGGAGITKTKNGACSAIKGGRDQKPRPCPLFCPYLYAPVCGSDGVTYPNTCTLDAAACTDPTISLHYGGVCGDTVHTDQDQDQDQDQEQEQQQPCPDVCPFDYAPVCGSDGNTYANLCTLQSIACLDSSLQVVAHTSCSELTFSY